MKSEDFIIKCKVIKDFTLNDFDKLQNLERGGARNNYGELYIRDTFECNEEMTKYLMGGNDKKEVVIKILEINPHKRASK